LTLKTKLKVMNTSRSIVRNKTNLFEFNINNHDR